MRPILLKLHNPHDWKTLFRVAIYWGSLPKRSVLSIALGHMENAVSPQEVPVGTQVLPTSIPDSCGRTINLADFRIYQFARGKDRVTLLPEVLIGNEHPALLVLHVDVPEGKPAGAPPRFDLIQLEGKRVVGGCTVVIAPEDGE